MFRKKRSVGIKTLLVGALLLIAGCTASTPPRSATPAPPLVTTNGCHLRGTAPLPDPVCTPGVTNPEVTPAVLASTICKKGWTATIRPPTSVTGRIKKDTDVAYGLPADTKGELDHLISLELGGAPADPKNLWVQPGPIPNGKDVVEYKLHTAVCSGKITLHEAQHAISTDWTTALRVTGVQ